MGDVGSQLRALAELGLTGTQVKALRWVGGCRRGGRQPRLPTLLALEKRDLIYQAVEGWALTHDGITAHAQLPPAAGLPKVLQIDCSGRDYDPHTGQTGDRCTEVFVITDPPHQNLTEQLLHTTARAAGWKIGHLRDGVIDAMCPACGRPDPTIAAMVRDLPKGST